MTCSLCPTWSSLSSQQTSLFQQNSLSVTIYACNLFLSLYTIPTALFTSVQTMKCMSFMHFHSNMAGISASFQSICSFWNKVFLSKNVKFASLIIFLNCTSPPQKELWQRCPQMSVHSDPQDLSVSAECLMSQDCEYAPDSHSEWAWPLHPHCSLAIALSDFPKWSAIVGKLPFKQMWIAKEKSGEKQTKKSKPLSSCKIL